MPTLVKVIEKIYNTAIRDLTAFGSFPFLFLFIIIFSDDLYWALSLFFSLIIVEIICIFFKLAFFKHRPNREDYLNFLDKINSSSFPSSHMARATFIYFSLAHFSEYYRAYILYVVVIIVGLSRVILKKHYVFDVVVGFLIGFIFFLTIFYGRF